MDIQKHKAVEEDAWHPLKQFTAARIALGRTGNAIPLKELLKFKLAHAHARDAVYAGLHTQELAQQLQQFNLPVYSLHSKAKERNEYLLHSKIHEWFANGAAPDDTDKLNAKVYADLFLTPDSDPWLGVVPRDTFTGLENNGLAQISERTFNTSTQTKAGL